jgi:N-acetylneuraminate synthase
MAEVKIGGKSVGDDKPCFIVGEIGINHNGDIKIAKKLIDTSFLAGVNAVKFQKRTIEALYTPEELAKPRETPFGTTYGEYRRAVEFGYEQYKEIDRYCWEKGMIWYASCWDEQAVDFISQFRVPCIKIPSASLTDSNLLRHMRSKKLPLILSTGMSTIEEVDHAVKVLGKDDLVILHSCSAYPSPYEEINLRVIPLLRQRYGVPVGYSGHETGIATSSAAVVLGACMVERHITLDRGMPGTDHAASLGINGLIHLVRDIRLVETGMGDGIKRVTESEIPQIKRLRRNWND